MVGVYPTFVGFGLQNGRRITISSARFRWPVSAPVSVLRTPPATRPPFETTFW